MSILPKGNICGLAEVVLRVRDLDEMQNFYSRTLGLQLWRRFGDDMAFFKLSPTAGSRPQRSCPICRTGAIQRDSS
jgi:catechol 2,3-dioxygenase-like lactoylglutathione lyase family enzyme